MKLSKEEARKRAVGLLMQVGMPEAEAVMRKFPHTLSGAEPSLTAPPLPSNPMIDNEVTLFPQPDSPTKQTTSPRSTWKLT